MQETQNKTNSKVKKKPRKKMSKHTKKKIYAISALILAILITAYLLVRVYATIQRNRYIPEPLSILFLGMDGGSPEFADREALFADVMMGISYNPDKNHIEMLSIPRDAYTQISCKLGDTQGEKINSAFKYGLEVGDGMGCMKDTITYSTGMEFNRYIRVDFDSVIQFGNKVGPIPITAINGNSGSTFCEQNQFGEEASFCWVEGQTYQMSGEELLAYSRHRRTDTTVFRERRAQQVVEQVALRVISLELTGQRQVVRDAFGYVDTDMIYEEVRALALNFVTFPSINNAQLQTTGLPNMNMPNSQLLISDGTNELLVATYMRNFRDTEFAFSFADVIFFTAADRFNPNIGYLRLDEPKDEPEEQEEEQEETPLSVSVSGPSVMTVGESSQLGVVLSDHEVSIASASFSSSNPTVLSVSEGGAIVANSAGVATVTVTVTTSDGRSVTGSIAVTVNAPAAPPPPPPIEPPPPVETPPADPIPPEPDQPVEQNSEQNSNNQS